MYILTHLFTLLAVDEASGTLAQIEDLNSSGDCKAIEVDPAEIARLETEQPKAGERGVAITRGPLAGYAYVRARPRGLFHLFKGGFMCASRSHVTIDRAAASTWETFMFVSPGNAAQHLRIPKQREGALAARVQALIDLQAPICLHFGCGPRLIDGFLNVDKYLHAGIAPFAFERNLGNYFLMDFTEMPWPIPDQSIDYVYSEDFIEHIPQKNQIAFLAESFRVLKHGAYNRVNAPCLVASMQSRSDFSKGFKGVYFDEFEKWRHVSLPTRGFMMDIGHAIGYRQVFFTAKNRGSSPYAVEDRRPGRDRDQEVGNLFTDFLK